MQIELKVPFQLPDIYHGLFRETGIFWRLLAPAGGLLFSCLTFNPNTHDISVSSTPIVLPLFSLGPRTIYCSMGRRSPCASDPTDNLYGGKLYVNIMEGHQFLL